MKNPVLKNLILERFGAVYENRTNNRNPSITVQVDLLVYEWHEVVYLANLLYYSSNKIVLDREESLNPPGLRDVGARFLVTKPGTYNTSPFLVTLSFSQYYYSYGRIPEEEQVMDTMTADIAALLHSVDIAFGAAQPMFEAYKVMQKAQATSPKPEELPF